MGRSVEKKFHISFPVFSSYKSWDQLPCCIRMGAGMGTENKYHLLPYWDKVEQRRKQFQAALTFIRSL